MTSSILQSRPDGLRIDRRDAQEAAVLEVMNRANYSGKGRTPAFEIASREKPELFAPQA